MSHTLSAPSQAVFRPRYPHVRALLAIATVVVIGLAIAALVLATSSHRSTTVVRGVISSPQTADLGAKLDHRGLRPVAPATTAPSSKSNVGAISRLNAAHFAAGYAPGR